MGECTGLLSELGKDGEIIAGGTDLLVRMKYRLSKPRHLVSLSKINELKRIEYNPGKGLSIGAGITLSRLASDRTIQEKCPALSSAAELVATKQVRNAATIGGNILQNTRCRYYNRSHTWGKAVVPCFKRNGTVCHVAPKGKRCFAVYQGDLAPLLIALKTTVRVVFPTGTEEIPVESLFSGNGRDPFHCLQGKVIQDIVIPDPALSIYCDYKKYRLRKGIDYPLAGVAIAVEKNKDGMGNLRICLTGISSSPISVPDVEKMVFGKPLYKELFRDIGRRAQAAAHPLANLEDDPEKRRFIIRIMTEDILTSFIT